MKYAMFAGLSASSSSAAAAFCFDFGSRPRTVLRLGRTPLPRCGARSVRRGAARRAVLRANQRRVRNFVPRVICCALFCRSSAPVRRLHRPPGENRRGWRVPLPLPVSPLRGGKGQARGAAAGAGGTHLLQGRLRGSSSEVQPERKQPPAFERLRPGEEGRRHQQAGASCPGQLLPPPRHRAHITRAGNSCHQHLHRPGKKSHSITTSRAKQPRPTSRPACAAIAGFYRFTP